MTGLLDQAQQRAMNADNFAVFESLHSTHMSRASTIAVFRMNRMIPTSLR